jgi:hypothetical protein
MSDPPVTWQVKVTPYDRGNMGVVKERLDAAGFSSVRRRRSLLLGVSTKEQGEEVAEQLRSLPMPPVELKVEKVSAAWRTLHGWFHGGGDAGGPHLGDTPSSWGDSGGGGFGGGNGGGAG